MPADFSRSPMAMDDDFEDEAKGGWMTMLGIDGMFDEVRRMNKRQVLFLVAQLNHGTELNRPIQTLLCALLRRLYSDLLITTPLRMAPGTCAFE